MISLGSAAEPCTWVRSRGVGGERRAARRAAGEQQGPASLAQCTCGPPRPQGAFTSGQGPIAPVGLLQASGLAGAREALRTQAPVSWAGIPERSRSNFRILNPEQLREVKEGNVAAACVGADRGGAEPQPQAGLFVLPYPLSSGSDTRGRTNPLFLRQGALRGSYLCLISPNIVSLDITWRGGREQYERKSSSPGRNIASARSCHLHFISR